jgi:hypothetical protein
MPQTQGHGSDDRTNRSFLPQPSYQLHPAGVRVMEVREAYSRDDFEWQECKRLAIKNIKEANVRLLRQYATERFGSLTSSSGPDAGEA